MVNGRLRLVLPGGGECGADVRLNFEYGHQWVTAECPPREVNVLLPSRCDRSARGDLPYLAGGGLDRIFRAGDSWSWSSLHFAGRMGKTDRKYAQSHRPYSVRIR